MGIITYINRDIDFDDEVTRVFAITKFGIQTRAALNRVASRITIETGLGQRTLVAAAYKEEDIDLVWNDGLRRVAPENKYEKAQDINYMSTSMDSASELGDILPVRLAEMVEFGEYGEGEVLHMWEIPFSVVQR